MKTRMGKVRDFLSVISMLATIILTVYRFYSVKKENERAIEREKRLETEHKVYLYKQKVDLEEVEEWYKELEEES